MQTPAQPSAKFLVALPYLAEGERYAGIAIGPDGKPTHHLILLPQQPATRLTWHEAVAWAKKIDATLPTRQELSLAFANCKDAFDPGLYWSCEEDTHYVGNAAAQSFEDGHQGTFHPGYRGRARAFRATLID